jgi:D-3-phosphoglycerate dehydrogenase
VAQLNKKPLKEVVIEYTGDFQGIDLSPVTTAILKGMLTPAVQDDVNFINAPVIAKERGIKVVEASSADSEDYINLITIHVVTTENRTTVAGTIYGKNEPRVVKIDNFRLELIPHGHLAVIQNLDKPGAIGSIGTTLGQHKINIGRMHVGQEENGEERNIIYLKTDTPIPDDVAEILRQLPMVRSVMTLEL